jgi:hypothetical protein
MKSFIKIFIFVFFSFSLSFSAAQQGSFSTKIISFPDTSCLGCQDSFSVSIKNLGPSNYVGVVSVYVSTDTITYSVASICSTTTVAISVLDSVQIPCTITFDTANFNPGNNIVVVWSSGNAIIPADSTRDKVYLKITSGINAWTKIILFALYPSLSSHYANIELFKKEIFPYKIRILNVWGIEEEVFIVSRNEEKTLLDISHLPDGVYFIEVSTPNLNFRNAQKFIKIH